jgi:hypothetical protein
VAEPRPIYTFTDSPFECPHCGRRLEFGDPVDHDDDGPIYEGECDVHGTFLVQAVEEPEDDE